MRVFLSFNSRDKNLAQVLHDNLLKLASDVTIFFSPVSLTYGFWLPKLAQDIRECDAFILLLGRNGAGPWQELEYYEALARHRGDRSFVLVPLIVGDGFAPGLPFLRTLHWIEARELDDGHIQQLIGALHGEKQQSPSQLWKLVQPYRGLEALTEADADYFYGRDAETQTVLQTLASHSGRLPILIGASGVGKSSIARAGVISALKSMSWSPTSKNTDSDPPWPDAFKDSRNSWVWLVIRPGGDPLEALASAFTRLWIRDPTDPKRAQLARDWADGLRRSKNKLIDLIEATQEKVLADENSKIERVLLYVDQMEELYARSLITAPDDSRQFSKLF
jgi:hypothetical protein